MNDAISYTTPTHYDAKVAGWWARGMSCWIAGGWCSGKGPWESENGVMVNSRKRHHLGAAGKGEERLWQQRT